MTRHSHPRRRPSAKQASSRQVLPFTPQEVVPIPLGCDAEGRPAELTTADLSTHALIVGASGMGKSVLMLRWLLALVCSTVAGIAFDPHGSMIQAALHEIAFRFPHLAERVLIWKPADMSLPTLTYQPLSVAPHSADFQSEMFSASILLSQGTSDVNESPRIYKWLKNIAYVIIYGGFSFLEIERLIVVTPDKQAKQARRAMWERVPLESVRRDWEMFEALPIREQWNIMEGPQNRLSKIVQNRCFRRFLGAEGTALDLQQVIDQGYVVLIDLNGRDMIPPELTRLLGIWLMNDIFRLSKNRNDQDPHLRPCRVFLDEADRFLTPEFAAALAELRKFRVHLTFCIQFLQQLEKDEGYLLGSVMTNCLTKFVFGGLGADDAKLLAEELSLGYLDYLSTKHTQYATKVRHIEETRTVLQQASSTSQGKTQTQSEGTSTTQSHSRGSTHGSSSSQGGSTGHTTTTTESTSISRSTGTSHSVTEGNSASSTSTTSSSQSRSQSTGTQHSSSTNGSTSTSSSTSRGHSQGTHASNQTGSSENLTHRLVPVPNGYPGQTMGQIQSNSSKQSASTHGTSSQTSQSESQGQSESSGWAKTEGRSRTSSRSEQTGASRGTGTTRSRQVSQGTQQSESQQQGSSQGRSESSQSSWSQQESHGTSESRSTSTAEQRSQSHGTSESTSRSEGRSEVPFLRPVEYQEQTSETFWSHTELMHMAAGLLKTMGVGEAVLQRRGQRPVHLKITYVPPVPHMGKASAVLLRRLYRRVFRAHAHWYAPVPDEVEAESGDVSADSFRQEQPMGPDEQAEDHGTLDAAVMPPVTGSRKGPFG